MVRRFWRLMVIVVLLLVTGMGADAQRIRSRRVIDQQRYTSAASEIVRPNPAIAESLRKTFSSILYDSSISRKEINAEELGARLRQHLQAQKLTLQIQDEGHQQILILRPLKQRGAGKALSRRRPSDSVIGRKLSEIKRREEVLEKMEAKEVDQLEPLRRGNQAKTDLEIHLAEVGVTDYAAVAKSFDGNSLVKEIIFQKEVTLLRIFGGESKPIGRYLFCCLEAMDSAPQSIQRFSGDYAHWTDASGLATPPGNLVEDLALVKLPAGTRAFIGVVADNFVDAAGHSKLGGNTQVFLPAVNDFPYDHYRLAGSHSSASDIIVQFDDGKILRFRRSPSLDRTKKGDIGSISERKL